MIESSSSTWPLQPDPGRGARATVRRSSAVAKTILIVDDHAAFRASARTLLESAGYEVVGEAEDGAGAVRLTEELRPDVVLLDVHLPDLHGFDVTERLRQLDDAPEVVLTSSRADYRSVVSSTSAVGFVPKDELSPATLEALLG
jgi:DNA-binding NarL/FixJ family response regulator